MPLYTVQLVKFTHIPGRDQIHIVEASSATAAKRKVAIELWNKYGDDPEELIKKMSAGKR